MSHLSQSSCLCYVFSVLLVSPTRPLVFSSLSPSVFWADHVYLSCVCYSSHIKLCVLVCFSLCFLPYFDSPSSHVHCVQFHFLCLVMPDLLLLLSQLFPLSWSPCCVVPVSPFHLLEHQFISSLGLHDTHTEYGGLGTVINTWFVISK